MLELRYNRFAKKIGMRISQLRHERNISQKKLADLAKMNPGYLSLVESGQRMPSLVMMAHLAMVFQVPLSDLFMLTR